MMGVPKRDPNTPPLEMVKVPPSISSTARVPFRAWEEGGIEEEGYVLFSCYVHVCEVEGIHRVKVKLLCTP